MPGNRRGARGQGFVFRFALRFGKVIGGMTGEGERVRVGSYVNWDAWDERLGEDICWVVGIEVDSSSADRSA